MKGLTATEGMETVKLEVGGDILEGRDLGEVGVWNSMGDMRAGVVIAETYLKKRDGERLRAWEWWWHVNTAAHTVWEGKGRFR